MSGGLSPIGLAVEDTADYVATNSDRRLLGSIVLCGLCEMGRPNTLTATGRGGAGRKRRPTRMVLSYERS